VIDYTLFNNKIVGGTLLYWAEVKEIHSAWSSTPLCENQVLQLWEISSNNSDSNCSKSIRFFRNGKGGVYSQHEGKGTDQNFPTPAAPKDVKTHFKTQ
jgi:hypothetical protein